jgi:hypothetical protein
MVAIVLPCPCAAPWFAPQAISEHARLAIGLVCLGFGRLFRARHV